jgi:hypothetical protein
MGKPAVKPRVSVKKKSVPAKRAVPRPWSRAELKTGVSMLDKNKPVLEIAEKVGRHPGSVASKIRREQLR